MCFVLANLLHNSEEVDRGEEVAPGKFGNGFLRRGRCRITHLINGWGRWLA